MFSIVALNDVRFLKNIATPIPGLEKVPDRTSGPSPNLWRWPILPLPRFTLKFPTFTRLSMDACGTPSNKEPDKAGIRSLLPPRPPKRRPPLLFKEGSTRNLESGIWNSRNPGLKTPRRFRSFTISLCFSVSLRFMNVRSPQEMKHPMTAGNRNRYFAYIIMPTQSSSGLPMCSANTTLRK